MMVNKPDAPATRRNRDAILTVLAGEFDHAQSVLEIGSGTGQHAVYFGRALPGIRWQTSDRAENHAGIKSWLADESLANVLPPIDLDVLEVDEIAAEYDAVFSANTAHIMSLPAVECMFRLVGRALSTGGIFCLYGPFNIGSEFTSESNENFDRSLRQQDPAMGIRDLEALDELAAECGLKSGRRYAMPANNMIVSWGKAEAGNGDA
jgi:SAM-dependent methyltransferase